MSTPIQILFVTALLTASAGMSAHAQTCPIDVEREIGIEQEVTQALFDGEPVRLDVEGSTRRTLAIWTPGRAGMPTIVLAHGPQRHVGSAVIAESSLALNELGYSTLALQMPMLRRDCESGDTYPATFDSAVARIDAASRWLQTRGHTDLVLFAHWLGNEYLARTPNAPFSAWIVNGITGNFSSIGDNNLRILDVYGSKGHEMTLRSAWMRRIWLWFCEDGQQVEIPDANHDFGGKAGELAEAIDRFLRAGRT